MPGLYDIIFGRSKLYQPVEMTEDQTNRHWKREEDNYLIQTGAMDKIKKDPNAALGYKMRQDPEMLTLNMDPFVNKGNWGEYEFTPGQYPDQHRPGTDGTVSVDVDLEPTEWAETLQHELGHVGSRFSMSDEDARRTFISGEEEARQRIADYVLNPPESNIHQDAIRYLENIGMPTELIEAQVSALRKKLGIKPHPPKKKQHKISKKQLPALFKDSRE